MIERNSIIIAPEILNIIADIDEFKGAWQFIKNFSPDRLSALKKVATIESIGSSTRIEGAKLSDREVEKLLSDIELKSFANRDEQEVVGYAYACEKIFAHYPDILLSENNIKQLHSWLLYYSEKDERHRGYYKTIPIRIEAFNQQGKSLGVIFETVSPLETPIRMQELIGWTQKALDERFLHPLIVIGLFVVIFLAIHPFQDGNGRLSRLLTTLLMMKSGYYYIAYSSLESIIEVNKESYYLALQKSQTAWLKQQPDWQPWLDFFLNCLQRQKKHLEIKLESAKSLFQELPQLQQKIIELLKEHGKLKISEIENLTGANRNTVKKQLAYLVQSGQILMHGKGKGSWYSIY